MRYALELELIGHRGSSVMALATRGGLTRSSDYIRGGDSS